jgi:hypothetical protein
MDQNPNVDWLSIAEQLNEQFANLAALLEGQVTHLKSNGWTDQQAREIVFKMVMGR